VEACFYPVERRYIRRLLLRTLILLSVTIGVIAGLVYRDQKAEESSLSTWELALQDVTDPHQRLHPDGD
jgi:hypothetical protein